MNEKIKSLKLKIESYNQTINYYVSCDQDNKLALNKNRIEKMKLRKTIKSTNDQK